MKTVFNFLAMFRLERRPGDLAFAVAFFVFALFCAAVLPREAQFLGQKTLVAEPGFWPSIGVLMMVGFGAIHLLGTWNAPRLPGRRKEILLWARSIEFVIWFAVYVWAVPILGYLLATLIFALLLTFRMGYRSWRFFVGAACLAIVVVVVFKAGLGVKIPAGTVYGYLPESIRTFFMIYL